MVRPKSEYVAAKDRAKLSAGKVIKMACELNNMTQAELAKRSGMQASNLSDIINGRRAIGRAVAEKLASVLNISPAVILFNGETLREGSDKNISRDRSDLLLYAMRALKKSENKRVAAQLAAMRNALLFIAQAMQPNPEDDISGLVENNIIRKPPIFGGASNCRGGLPSSTGRSLPALTAKGVAAHKMKTKHHH